MLYNTVQTDHIYLINVDIQALPPRQQHKMLQRSQQLLQLQQVQSYQVETATVIRDFNK